MNVWFSYKAIFGRQFDASWSRVIRAAEWHLWASGFAIIELGIGLSGWAIYLANPKLWAKALVVTVWLLSTLVLRHLAKRDLRTGNRRLILSMCSISAACWIYGAFLGVAKTLANGAAPLSVLVSGFLLTVFACSMTTAHFENARFYDNNS